MLGEAVAPVVSPIKPKVPKYTHSRSKDFIACFNAQRGSFQEAAQTAFKILKKDPGNPNLHFKPLPPFKTLWSARVGSGRALAVKNGNHFTWVWCDASHSKYDDAIALIHKNDTYV